MQREHVVSLPRLANVSILIRSEDRMQQASTATVTTADGFQSSSGPRTGCNAGVSVNCAAIQSFQSSSGPRTGCNSFSQTAGKRHGFSAGGGEPAVATSALLADHSQASSKRQPFSMLFLLRRTSPRRWGSFRFAGVRLTSPTGR